MADVVSIVLTAKDIEGFIARCLNSLIRQTYKNLEIVVVDDGSSDKTVEIVEKYMRADERIKLFFSNSHNKQLARNLGIKNATGKYLMIIDGDDELVLDAIAWLVEIFRRENVGAVFGATEQIFPDGKRLLYAPKEGRLSLSNRAEALSFLEFIYSGEFVGRGIYLRELITEYYEKDILLWDNNLFILRALKNIKNFYCTPKLIYGYYYLQRKGSSIVGLLKESIFEQTKIAYPYYLNEAKKIFKDKSLWFYMASILLLVLCADVRALERKPSLKALVESELNDPLVYDIFGFLEPASEAEKSFKEAFMTKDLDKIKKYFASNTTGDMPFCAKISAIQDVVDCSFEEKLDA